MVAKPFGILDSGIVATKMNRDGASKEPER
jgi:hypothetical protein